MVGVTEPMPSLDENKTAWSRHSWTDRGEEWSAPWGCTRSLWNGTIVPRIASRVPCHHILEIGTGHGRCTQYLLALCRRFTGVDLVPECVEACRERFAGTSHASWYLNDGLSLDTVEEGCVDLAFSWDSLVHADEEVLAAYLGALATRLRPGGRAFLHHSTLGDYQDETTRELKIPNPCWRDPGMTAAKLRGFAAGAGLLCISQELVPWGGENMTDCFSLLERPLDHSQTEVETVVRRHLGFGQEVSNLRRIHDTYGCSELHTGAAPSPQIPT